ncbi:UNVERIFIED_CONTAM: hypothetical protein GTU68_058083 [Idotea baltica]|nr:hypothetical protein [Idotea baltica]
MSSIETLIGAVNLANERVFSRARDDDTVAGMGTTLVGIGVLNDGSLGLVNVGDSRIYALSADVVEQISIDHSFVEQLVRSGRLTREQAASHPQKNVVTRAIGIEPRVDVDAWTLRPEEGDRILLCSDGLSNEVSDSEIAEILRDVAAPDAAAEALVARANANGGRDNITCAVVDVIEGDAQSAATLGRAMPHGTTGMSDLDGMDTELGVTPQGASTVVPANDGGPQRGRRQRLVTWRVAAVIGVIISVFAAAAGAIAWYAGNTFLVGELEGEVVIYEGRPGGVLWIDPTILRQGIELDELVDESQRQQIQVGVDQPSLDAATDYVNDLCTIDGGDSCPTSTTTTTSTTTAAPATTAAPTTAVAPTTTAAPPAP